MDTTPIFSENLIALGMRAVDAADVITQLGRLLQDAGCVRDTFVPAAIERENVFATGLPLGRVNVALPHTDAVHVLHPAIAVGCLQEPVEFHVMGSPDDVVQVRIVFLMAIQNDQVLMLQALCDTLQHPTFIDDLLQAASAQQALSILNTHFEKTGVTNASN